MLCAGRGHYSSCSRGGITSGCAILIIRWNQLTCCLWHKLFKTKTETKVLENYCHRGSVQMVLVLWLHVHNGSCECGFQREGQPPSPLPSFPLSSCHIACVCNTWRRSELIMMHGMFALVVIPHLQTPQWPPTVSFTPQNKNWHNLFHAPFQLPFPSAPLPILWVRQLFLCVCVWQVFRSADGKAAKI